nr:capsid protein [Banfec virus 3]
MVYRRRRRRPRRIRRRYGRRYRLRRRLFRRSRRSRRSRRTFTVRYQRDFQLSLSSLIPASYNVAGTPVGVPSEGFRTWSVMPIPQELMPPNFGVKVRIGQHTTDASITSIPPAIPGNYPPNTMLTDLPIVLCSRNLATPFNCINFWNICHEYRISSVSISFTIPEFQSVVVDGTAQTVKNHHLYLEWSYLPKASACRPDDLYASFLYNYDDNPISTTGQDLESAGWNWICSPVDIAQACSVDGRYSQLHNWHRQQLSSATPVTIKFRPRHSRLNAHTQFYVDRYPNSAGASSSAHSAQTDIFSQSKRLTRSYVSTSEGSTSVTGDSDPNGSCWFGPVVRLIDADLDINNPLPASYKGKSLYDIYGIRCTITARLKLRGAEAADPLFPSLGNAE